MAKQYSNIVPDSLERGAWVGGGGGNTWHIRKTTCSHGKYVALPNLGDVQTRNTALFAWTLDAMNSQLAALVVHDYAVSVSRLTSGFFHVRGRNANDWAQPQSWPCTEAELRAAAFAHASEGFIRKALTMMA